MTNPVSQVLEGFKGTSAYFKIIGSRKLIELQHEGEQALSTNLGIDALALYTYKESTGHITFAQRKGLNQILRDNSRFLNLIDRIRFKNRLLMYLKPLAITMTLAFIFILILQIFGKLFTLSIFIPQNIRQNISISFAFTTFFILCLIPWLISMFLKSTGEDLLDEARNLVKDYKDINSNGKESLNFKISSSDASKLEKDIEELASIKADSDSTQPES